MIQLEDLKTMARYAQRSGARALDPLQVEEVVGLALVELRHLRRELNETREQLAVARESIASYRRYAAKMPTSIEIVKMNDLVPGGEWKPTPLTIAPPPGMKWQPMGHVGLSILANAAEPKLAVLVQWGFRGE